jgi:hypothetical protein
MDAAAIRRSAQGYTHHSFGVTRHVPIEIRGATAEEYGIICSFTRGCATQSRGFTIETPESLRTWLEETDNALVVAAEHRPRADGHAISMHSLGLVRTAGNDVCKQGTGSVT